MPTVQSGMRSKRILSQFNSISVINILGFGTLLGHIRINMS